MNMRVQLFKITQCGFYNKEDYFFGDISEWSEDFLQWVYEVSDSGVDYSRTYTFPSRDNKVPDLIFAMGAVEDEEGNFGLVLWNQGHRGDRGTMHAALNGPLGGVEAGTTDIPRGTRPGWPSYFWIMPREGIIVAMMPGNSVTDISSLRDYIKGYLRYRSNYRLEYKGDNSRGEPKYSYAPYGNTEAVPGVFPKFDTRQPIVYEFIENILDNYDQINRFFVHSDFVLVAPDSNPMKGFLERNLFGYRNDQEQEPARRDRTTRIEIDWTPATRRELEEVVEEWMSESHGPNSWAGVMFKGSGNNKHRFDSAKCDGEVDLDDELNFSPSQEVWGNEQFRMVWEQSKSVVRQLQRKAPDLPNPDEDDDTE